MTMTFDFDVSELTQTAARRVTPHDNCIVTELGSGVFPRYIKVQLPDDDGPQQVALWDGSLDLEVNDEVYCHEYAEISIWRIMAMGGADSGAGKQRVSKVWESDFENVVMSIDAAGLVTFQPAADSTTFLQMLDADGGTPILNVDSTNERIGIGTASPDGSLHVDVNDDLALLVEQSGVNDEALVVRTSRAGPQLGQVGINGPTHSSFAVALNIAAGNFEMANSSQIRMKDSGGAGRLILRLNASDEMDIGGSNAALSDLFLSAGSVSRGITLQATSGNVGIGTTSPSTRLHTIDEDAVTAAVTDIATLGHNSTSTPAANFGAGLLYQLESSTTEDQDAARIAALWADATHASRASALTFETLTGAGSLTEQMRIDGDGNVGIGTASPNLRTSIANTGTNSPPLVPGNFNPTSTFAQPEVALGLINENASGNYVGMSFQVRSTNAPSAVMYLERTANFQGDMVLQIRDASGTSPEIMRWQHTGNVGIGTASPNTLLHVDGPIATALATKTTNYTITATDSTILADTTSQDITITLPTAIGIPGRMYTIHKIDSSANKVTVDGSGAETINGATTLDIFFQYDALQIVSDGSNWFAR